MPDNDKLEKGVNCIINLVYYTIQKYNQKEKKLVIICDNYINQNKNNYSIFFYLWLINYDFYKEIKLNFIIPGYIKFICDSCFSLIKILYWVINTVKCK
jgi:hypothetical protein